MCSTIKIFCGRVTLHIMNVNSHAVLPLFLLPSLYQTCSRVLLHPQDKELLRVQLLRPGLSALARKGLAKKINEKCRKIQFCPYCGRFNGTVGEWEESKV